MENSESKLTPEQSLLVIHQTIEKAKREVQENGFHLLLWGTLVVIAGLVDFYMSYTQGAGNQHYAWAVMPAIGVPVAIIYESRRKKQPAQRNTIHNWYGLVWLGFGISLPMLIAYTVMHHLPPTQPIMVVTGFALFMSGIVLSFRPLIWGAAVIWAGAVICLFTAPNWHSLIMAIGVALGYLVPGYLLQRAKKIAIAMYEDLDNLLLSQLRLAAMSYLMVVKEADFNTLKEQTGATSGNLSVQINKLQEAGYIQVEKTYRNNYPLTLCQITPAGIQAFEAFYQRLQTYFKEKPG